LAVLASLAAYHELKKVEKLPWGIKGRRIIF
jgi:hypothetical protein